MHLLRKTVPLLLAAALVSTISGCASIPFERTYSLRYGGVEGPAFETGVTFRPIAPTPPKAVLPRGFSK